MCNCAVGRGSMCDYCWQGNMRVCVSVLLAGSVGEYV